MTTYRIITTSVALSLISIFALVLSGSLLLHEILPKGSSFSILAAFILLAVAIILQRFISIAVIELSIFDSEISIKWIKQFIFHNRKESTVRFSEIESWKYQEDSNFDLFKLTLKDGRDITLWHFTFTRKDDFKRLVEEFPIYINKYNSKKVPENHAQEQIAEKHKIEKIKTIFEKSYAPFIAAFAVLLLVATVFIFVTRPQGKPNPPYGLLGAASGGLFFIAQYLKHRNKK